MNTKKILFLVCGGRESFFSDEDDEELRELSVEIQGLLVNVKTRPKPGAALRVAEEFLAHILIFSESNRTTDWRRVTDVRPLSSIEVTPLGCQRANSVLNFWRESLWSFG